jgi:hypothetical protein
MKGSAIASPVANRSAPRLIGDRRDHAIAPSTEIGKVLKLWITAITRTSGPSIERKLISEKVPIIRPDGVAGTAGGIEEARKRQAHLQTDQLAREFEGRERQAGGEADGQADGGFPARHHQGIARSEVHAGRNVDRGRRTQRDRTGQRDPRAPGRHGSTGWAPMSSAPAPGTRAAGTR